MYTILERLKGYKSFYLQMVDKTDTSDFFQHQHWFKFFSKQHFNLQRRLMLLVMDTF